MPKIDLIIGPVGSGKSTFARPLSHENHAARFILDEWMSTLYGADERPAEGRIEWSGTSVVLEIGLITREARQRI